MAYSIGEVAQIMGVTASTLRYYDKEGLLPRVERTAGGIRSFSDADIETLRIIECLKRTGMPIRDIKQFMDWCQQGDATLEQRREMFHERRRLVQQQMAQLQATLDTINYKCWYYETACELGSSQAVMQVPESDWPEDVRRAHDQLCGDVCGRQRAD